MIGPHMQLLDQAYNYLTKHTIIGSDQAYKDFILHKYHHQIYVLRYKLSTCELTLLCYIFNPGIPIPDLPIFRPTLATIWDGRIP